jgi:aminoglycoside phosphotransferase (APT) family kinase protein
MPAPRRDLETTKEALQRWLAGKLPASTSVRVEHLRGPSETGYSSDTLLFDAVIGAATSEQRLPLVARLEPQGVTVFPQYDMERQFRLMQWLAEQGTVLVPRVLWYEGSRDALGVPFFVMEYVDGQVPSDNPPYHVTGWLHDLSTSERQDLWLSGLRAMAAVHRLDAAPLIGTLFPRPPAGRTFLEDQLEEYERYVTWGLDASRYPLLGRAARWLRAHAPAEHRVALCWGDARLGNQLFRATQCVALLDWEMARIGDPQQDLAWFVALDRCFSEGLGVDPLPGLSSADEAIRVWEEATGFSAGDFRYYEILALYKFAAIMARVITQLKFYDVFPEDSDMDVHNLASAVLERALLAVGA